MTKHNFFNKKKTLQEKLNRTNTNSGNYIEHILIKNNNIEGIRQADSVTSGIKRTCNL